MGVGGFQSGEQGGLGRDTHKGSAYKSEKQARDAIEAIMTMPENSEMCKPASDHSYFRKFSNYLLRSFLHRPFR